MGARRGRGRNPPRRQAAGLPKAPIVTMRLATSIPRLRFSYPAPRGRFYSQTGGDFPKQGSIRVLGLAGDDVDVLPAWGWVAGDGLGTPSPRALRCTRHGEACRFVMSGCRRGDGTFGKLPKIIWPAANASLAVRYNNPAAFPRARESARRPRHAHTASTCGEGPVVRRVVASTSILFRSPHKSIEIHPVTGIAIIKTFSVRKRGWEKFAADPKGKG